MNQQTKWSQFGVLISVFFFWGFVAASNDILIPVFKEKLNLQQWQSQLISSAFYIAYTVGSLLYIIASQRSGEDILNRIGYKNGIALGLVISALGTLLFYPAAQTASFNLLLAGLFIVGLGFSLQQTAANPLAITMGDPRLGSQRLSLAGGVNNFGTTIGPTLVSLAIFGSVNASGAAKTASIESVKTPYLILGVLFILVAIVFRFSSVPDKIQSEPEKVAITSPTDTSEVAVKVERKAAWNYMQLALGMIGIFVYVGVEVSTASNLPEYMLQKLKTPTENIAPYVSLYWASLMAGRWTASVGAFGVSATAKRILDFVMPYMAFAVFLIVNKVTGHDIKPFFIYAVVILAIIIANLLSKGNPARQLLIFSICGIIALLIGMLSSGLVSTFAFISVGLFCSTLWPCIFTLAIAGLGKHTNEGASLLVMMIAGGALIPLLQGVLASDKLLGIQWSYITGVACFAYLAYYAVKAKSILKAEGIDYDKLEGAGSH